MAGDGFDENTVPPGWYPDANGVNRYWDGKRWLALPDPATQPDAATARRGIQVRMPSRKVLMASAAALMLLVGGGVTWIVVGNANERSAQEAAAAADEAQAARVAAAREEQERKDSVERLLRAGQVSQIQDSVKAMAEEHIEKGFMTGPIIKVSCSPVGGGSTDDLTETTTVFDCFAANKDNGDGTMSGYKYHSTMNWSTGSFTYGRGAP